MSNESKEKHDVPMCTHCGHIGPWKVSPVIRPVDWVIGVLLLLFGCVPGLVYLAVVAIIRSNEDRRSKICTNCGSKNLFTFFY